MPYELDMCHGMKLKYADTLTEQYLRTEYQDKQRTMASLARENNVAGEVIASYLVRADIPIRHRKTRHAARYEREQKKKRQGTLLDAIFAQNQTKTKE